MLLTMRWDGEAARRHRQHVQRMGPTNWRGGHSNGGPSQYRGNGRGRPGFNNMSVHRGRGGSFWASKRLNRDTRYDCKDVIDARECGDDAMQTLLYADTDYVVPLFVNGLSTHGVRDSGCNFLGLVAKNLVRPESINYQKCITLKGAFDKGGSHKVPTAVVKIRSPRFLYDRDVQVTMGVSDSLPHGINCLLGNELFRCHKQLTDIISVRQNVTNDDGDTETQQQTTGEFDKPETDVQQCNDSLGGADARQVDRSGGKSMTETVSPETDTDCTARHTGNVDVKSAESRHTEIDVLTDMNTRDAIDTDSRESPLIDTNGVMDRATLRTPRALMII